jgi:Cu-Zn family superoxide dismutase
MRGYLIAGAAMLAIAGCSESAHQVGQPLARAGQGASATLHDAKGAVVGHAVVSEVQGGLRLTLDTDGLPGGTHGVHIHAVGRCDPPDFASAGGHWNPLGAHHGSLNPAGPHMGDLPNLEVPSSGRASLGANVPGATLAGLLDADGAAIVVHAGPDDMMSDPSGNSGGRIACGVFAADS